MGQGRLKAIHVTNTRIVYVLPSQRETTEIGGHITERNWAEGVGRGW